MMYWDSSAILPLLVGERDSERRRGQLAEDPLVVTWWGTKVECASALGRLCGEDVIDGQTRREILDDLETLARGWIEVQATEKLRQRALRLLRVHALRATDALQLASALIASDETPDALPFACGDRRLVEAAEREGFRSPG